MDAALSSDVCCQTNLGFRFVGPIVLGRADGAPTRIYRGMGFGQLVIGPPGSGKTTYCNGIQHFFQLTGRPCAVVNLDPANHDPPYECAVSIEELITLEEAQREFNLGPNGAMVYCIEYASKNLDWLKERVTPLVAEGKYVLFDLPGQVELFNMHDALREVVAAITGPEWNLRLCTVHLIDSHLCADPTKYIAALMLSLSSMLHLETPHVNVLSKVDLMDKYGELDFNLEYYADVMNLEYLADRILDGNQDVIAAAPSPGQTMMRKRYGKLTKGLCELVEDFGLVNFTTLSIEDKTSVERVVQLTDKSIGYFNAGGFSAAAGPGMENAVGGRDYDERALVSNASALTDYERNFEVQERFFTDRD